MQVKKIIIAGILAGIVILVVSSIVSYIVQLIQPYDVLQLGGMRSVDSPIMMLFFLHPWVLSFAMAIVYNYVGSAFQGTFVQKGTRFGLLMWLVASIPPAFIVYTSMNYPTAFTVNSVVGSILYMLSAGIVIAKLME